MRDLLGGGGKEDRSRAGDIRLDTLRSGGSVLERSLSIQSTAASENGSDDERAKEPGDPTLLQLVWRKVRRMLFPCAA